MSDSNITHETSKRKLFGNSVSASAVVKKLTYGNTIGARPGDIGDTDSITTDMSALHRIAQNTSQSINDVENIFEVIPETELAMQILVSSIMSPNDMRAPELTWSSKQSKLHPSLVEKMVKVLKKYFEGDFGIKDRIQSMLEDALFYTGSYPMMIVPENVLDDLINGNEAVSTESLKSILNETFTCKPTGILGPGLTTKKKGTSAPISSMEDFLGSSLRTNVATKSIVDPLVNVTDNYGSLRVPAVMAKIRNNNISNNLRNSVNTGSMEGMALTLNQVASTFYERKNIKAKHSITLGKGDSATKASTGHPMDIKVPSDSIITVHVPNNPKEHLGYYLLLDQFGNPISNARDSSYYNELTANNASIKKTAASGIMAHINESMYGSSDTVSADSINQMQVEYGKAMEKDLLERLRNGLYGKNVEIGNANEIYRIMLARSLANMNTQVLYVPAELMTYVAFDYNRMGIGRSLLEKSKMLSGIRSILLFSNTMAAVNNSINSKQINIGLSAEDMEPEATVEMILTEYHKAANAGLPLATTNPMDILDGIRKSATQVAVTGNPNWADTTVSVENLRKDNVVVDSTLEETLRDRHLMSMSITPELIDSSTTIDFAIEAINRNLLFNKRLAMYQAKTQDFVTDYVCKYSINSGTLMAELIEIIKKGEIDEDGQALTDSVAENLMDTEDTQAKLEGKPDTYMDYLVDFFDSLRVELPQPDNTKVSNQLETLEAHGQAIDMVLPNYINEDILRESHPDASPETIKAIIKGYLLRNFMSENNILPEVSELFATDGTSTQAIDMLEKHEKTSGGISRVVDGIVKRQAAKGTTDEDDTDSVAY